MTLEEAKTWAEIIRWADGGCSHCVRELAEAATEAFPEFRFTMRDSDEVLVDVEQTPVASGTSEAEYLENSGRRM